MRDKRILLASESPRRKELLALTGLKFDTTAPAIDEAAITAEVLDGREADEPFVRVCRRLVMALALAKTEAMQAEATVVVGADTVVVLDDQVLGKPKDRAEAEKMLRSLLGRTHTVVTGVAISSGDRSDVFSSETEVRFFPEDQFAEDWIDRYLDSGSPLDKAGAYGIQDEGALLVEAIDGDFYTVMGLPIGETARRLFKHL